MASNDHQDAQFLPTNSPTPNTYTPPPGMTVSNQPQSEPDAQQAASPQFQQTVPPVQNIYITQQVQQSAAPAVLVAAPKSVATALILTFFFGPLGMFYSTVSGAIIMLIASIMLAAFTLGFSLFITWPICMIWGAVAASQYNNRLVVQSTSQIIR